MHINALHQINTFETLTPFTHIHEHTFTHTHINNRHTYQMKRFQLAFDQYKYAFETPSKFATQKKSNFCSFI